MILSALAFSLLMPPLAQAAILEPASAARFRMVAEALRQAEHMTGNWDPGQRDCAGFVRFLYRQSVPAREPLWLDRDRAPASFLKADDLIAYNFDPVSRVPSKDTLETGDLLAFHMDHKPPAEAWHLMVILKPPGMATDRVLVVYHNGGDRRDGQVRKVWLDDMREGPPEWRPDGANPRFVGTFRWRGWSQRFSGGR